MDNGTRESSAKEKPTPKDSFLDDLLYVATETADPLAEPKKDPLPGKE